MLLSMLFPKGNQNNIHCNIQKSASGTGFMHESGEKILNKIGS